MRMRYKLLYDEEAYEVMNYDRMAPISDAEYRILAAYDEDDPKSYRKADKILDSMFRKKRGKANDISYSVTYMEEYDAIKIGVMEDGNSPPFPNAYALVPENSPFFNIDLLTSGSELLDKFTKVNVKGTQPWIFYYDMTDF